MVLDKRYLIWRLYKARIRVKRKILSRLYLDRFRTSDRAIIEAGVSRSGTTWLGDVIARQINGRIMFEPFNSNKVQASCGTLSLSLSTNFISCPRIPMSEMESIMFSGGFKLLQERGMEHAKQVNLILHFHILTSQEIHSTCPEC